jgi:hypothetical protein
MTDVFISYGRNDWHRAQQLARILEAEGLSVWWDRKIPLGKTFDRAIQKALDRASCIVVLWSTTSVESSWVRDEAWIGLSRRVLVPILMDDVAIPLGFGRIQTANLVEWTGDGSHPELVRVKESIKRLLRREDTIDSFPALPTINRKVPVPVRVSTGPRPVRSPAHRPGPVRPPPRPFARQRLLAARRQHAARRWRPWVLLFVLVGLLAFGVAGGRFHRIDLHSWPTDIVDFAREALSVATDYGLLAVSSIGTEANELLGWVKEAVGSPTQGPDERTVLGELAQLHELTDGAIYRPELTHAKERIQELEAIVHDSATIALDDEFVTCETVILDRGTPELPIGVRREFYPGPVYVFARVHAPRPREELTLSWSNEDGLVAETRRILVPRVTDAGYPIFAGREYANPGRYAVRLYNEQGNLIGRRLFRVRERPLG